MSTLGVQIFFISFVQMPMCGYEPPTFHCFAPERRLQWYDTLNSPLSTVVCMRQTGELRTFITYSSPSLTLVIPAEWCDMLKLTVASLWGRPGWHPPGGDTRTNFLWANLQRIVDKRGRRGKKKVRGDTRVKSTKWRWWAKKVSFYEKINRGDTAELADGDD